jgi:hypothetical protein
MSHPREGSSWKDLTWIIIESKCLSLYEEILDCRAGASMVRCGYGRAGKLGSWEIRKSGIYEVNILFW